MVCSPQTKKNLKLNFAKTRKKDQEAEMLDLKV